MKVVDYTKTYDDIIKVPLPEATDTYVPVANEFVVKSILERVHKEGYQYMGGGYRLAQNDQVNAGLIAVAPKAYADMGIVHNISYLNSYNKSKRLSLGAGGMILVCANGMFTKKLFQGSDRKHQGTVLEDMDAMLDIVFADLDQRFEELVEMISLLKNVQVPKEILWQVIGSLIMGNIIPIRQINVLKKNLKKDPNFQMLGEGGKMTGWNMYNQITELLKPVTADKLVDTHVNAHELVSNVLVETGLISGDNVALFSNIQVEDVQDLSETQTESIETTLSQAVGDSMESVEKLPEDIATALVGENQEPDQSCVF